MKNLIKKRSNSNLQGQWNRYPRTSNSVQECLGTNQNASLHNSSYKPRENISEFETVEERNRRQPMEGQLNKYTNVMKGWQFRWFSLDPESGYLEYFEKEEHKKQRPRGALHLAGAVISPSDEDSQTFIVHAANGELYRLKAIDARERQHWVDKLRATAEYHTANLAQNPPPVQTRHTDGGVLSASNSDCSASSRKPPSDLNANNRRLANSTESLPTIVTMRSQYKVPVTQSPSVDPFKDVKEYLFQAAEYSSNLGEKITELPHSGQYINGIDKDLLLLKATSSATVHCLQDCLNILQMRQILIHGNHVPRFFLLNTFNKNALSGPFTLHDHHQHSQSLPPSMSLAKQSVQHQRQAHTDPESSAITSHQQPKQGPHQTSLYIAPHSETLPSDQPSPCESYTSTTSLSYSTPTAVMMDKKCDGFIDHMQDVEDEEEYKDTELGAVEEHKSIILHLLSQLKLGMDLTKVVLPTFILEKRSLLEMFADCMAHPLLFLKIPDLADPEQRMLAVVEWYLTSFHAGRQGSVAKKPYNPIRGETFHCSWKFPKSSEGHTDNGLNTEQNHYLLTYCAEQVSHHPPISAFYFECPDKQISMNASIWTKSKFMGMSIGVMMVGKVSLNLLEFDEEYVFGLPSVYARSILTVPWVELGDKIYINCRKTGYSAAVTFHTKPFYGGKLHRIAAEVKNNMGTIICKGQGEWNNYFEFTYENGETKTIDVSSLEIMRKCVRPISMQGEFESRRLWQHVTNALKLGDVNIATEHKKFLEDRQREGERLRKETNTEFATKHFHLDGEDWVYNKILRSRHKEPCDIKDNNNSEDGKRCSAESPLKSNKVSQNEPKMSQSNNCYDVSGAAPKNEKNTFPKDKSQKKDSQSSKTKISPKTNRTNKNEKTRKNEKCLKDVS
ncbi:oxysterol-binding protein-related protein 11 isoform X1 [Octopus sinensis]|uniref:Oxysterol-binding protein n=2 Tax=Octopus sinensis TaxID=2607531 RepID=A0A7E6FE04_9MOLL|nr:oxysterol-binding protein-related protein 11 isoform X1 [Octopus sinensis]